MDKPQPPVNFTNIWITIMSHIKKVVVDFWKLMAVGKRWEGIISTTDPQQLSLGCSGG